MTTISVDYLRKMKTCIGAIIMKLPAVSCREFTSQNLGVSHFVKKAVDRKV